MSNFVNNFVVGDWPRRWPRYFVLRAILDTAAGGHPLPSVIAAMFLLGVQATYNLLQSYNTGTPYATADVLDSLWTYLVGTIMPITAGLAIIGAIINFATQGRRCGWSAWRWRCCPYRRSGTWSWQWWRRTGADYVSFHNGILNLTNWSAT